IQDVSDLLLTEDSLKIKHYEAVYVQNRTMGVNIGMQYDPADEDPVGTNTMHFVQLIDTLDPPGQLPRLRVDAYYRASPNEPQVTPFGTPFYDINSTAQEATAQQPGKLSDRPTALPYPTNERPNPYWYGYTYVVQE